MAPPSTQHLAEGHLRATSPAPSGTHTQAQGGNGTASARCRPGPAPSTGHPACAHHPDHCTHVPNPHPTLLPGSQGAGCLGDQRRCDICTQEAWGRVVKRVCWGAGERRGAGARSRNHRYRRKRDPSLRRESIRGSLWPAESSSNGVGDPRPGAAAQSRRALRAPSPTATGGRPCSGRCEVSIRQALSFLYSWLKFIG